MYRVLLAMQIALEPQNRGQQLMKTMVKCENDKFLVITIKHVLGFTVVVNCHGTPKLCAIAHEKCYKTRKQ